MFTAREWIFIILVLIAIYSVFYCIANVNLIIDYFKRSKQKFSGVDEIIASIDKFFNTHSELSTIALPDIKDEAIKRIKQDIDGAMKALEDDSPSVVALLVIKNVSFDFLWYGKGYVYRGTLSYAGQYYLLCYKNAMQQLVSLGIVSQIQYANELEILNKQIKENG